MSLRLTRIFIIFGLILSLFIVAPSPAYASPDPGLWDLAKGVFSVIWAVATRGETSLEPWVAGVVNGIESTTGRLVVGYNFSEMETAMEQETFASTGLIAAVGALADQTYNYPPDIHLAGYVRNEFGDNLLNAPTYATFGTEWLNPVQDTWEAMRNIAYALFVVIVGAIALMIILQKQVETRVVVTVTHALPKIFMSLILITLSFPIAALFVDIFIVWIPKVLVNLPGPLKIDLPAQVERLTELMPPTQQGVVLVFGGIAQKYVHAILNTLGSLRATCLPPVDPSQCLDEFSLVTVFVLFAIVGLCVLGLVSLQLVYRYARILILTVFSPLLLLFGSLPGQEGVTIGWVKDLLVQAFVFPGILIIAFVSAAVLEAAPTAEGGAAWPEPLAGFMPSGAPFAAAITALIILIMSFKIPGIIENAVKGKRK